MSLVGVARRAAAVVEKAAERAICDVLATDVRKEARSALPAFKKAILLCVMCDGDEEE